MTRTRWPWAVLIVISVVATCSPPAFAQGGAPIPGDPVRIESGKLSGVLLPSGVRAYLGVPYAAPPVRELRWREPRTVAAWTGVYHADRKAPECIQVLRRKNLNHYFGEEATSEDCLYLNVWTPGKVKAGAKLPVIVFIYGGGFTLGSSGMAMYGGEHVAVKNAVFVNFNYRVGALGYLAHPELTAESPNRASGNYGFLDQIAALRWIQKNIDKFGGDPGNVTVSGQSAGAMAVSALAASPLAKGLIHRGFGMSFSFLDPRFRMMTAAEVEKIGLEVQQALEVKSLAEMRMLPADKILAVQRDCQLGCAGAIRIGTSVDGYFLPDSVAGIYAAGKQNDIPIVSGFTRDESFNDVRAAKTVDDYVAAARKMYGDRAEQFLKLYPVSNDAEVTAMGVVAAREAQAQLSSRLWALAHTATGQAPFYMYMFARVHPFAEGVTFFDNPRAIGAYHTSDVPYWFQTQEAFNLFRKTRDWTALDRELSARMMDTLLAFARTGDPTTPATAWPRWRVAEPRYVEFGDVTRVATEHTERMEFHTPRTR